MCGRRGGRRSPPPSVRSAAPRDRAATARSGAAGRPPRGRSWRPVPRRGRRGRCARRPSDAAGGRRASGPRTVCRARSSSSWTVRSPGWRAQPAKAVPSYSIVSFVFTEPRRLARRSVPVSAGAAAQTSSMKTISVESPARTELQDARVAARALGVARRDLLEQLVDRELVLRERRERLAAGVQVAALGERDQLLDLRLDGLRLRLGRLDPLVLDQLLGQVHQQRLAVGAVAAELVAGLLVAHGSGILRVARGRSGAAAPSLPSPGGGSGRARAAFR